MFIKQSDNEDGHKTWKSALRRVCTCMYKYMCCTRHSQRSCHCKGCHFLGVLQGDETSRVSFPGKFAWSDLLQK